MPNRKRCVIIGGADIKDYARARELLRKDDYIIYCDSGLKHMELLGAEPDLIVGDFDSHEDPHLDRETIVLPRAKDDTDTVFAAKEAFNRGFRVFLMLGAIGGRLDHTLANVYCLLWLRNRGCEAAAADDSSDITVILPGEIAFIRDSYPYFSLVSLNGDSRGVTIRNALFPLEDAVIRSEYQYGVSNEVLPGKAAEVSFKEGALLLIMDL